MTKRTTLGSFEIVSLPEFKVESVVAKIDTGAYSGALHCSLIKKVHRGLKRQAYLKFTPFEESQSFETSDFVKTYVRSSTGHRVKRFIINTTIDIKGKQYPINIGLSDRSDMKRPVLIGRRFIRENDMLVDVSLNQQYEDEGDLAL